MQPPYLERACVRAPGPSRGIDPNRLSTDPVFRSVESYVVHDATLSRAIETYIGQTAVVVKNQHIWCKFAKSVSSVWQENALFVFVVVIVLIIDVYHCCVMRTSAIIVTKTEQHFSTFTVHELHYSTTKSGYAYYSIPICKGVQSSNILSFCVKNISQFSSKSLNTE